MMIEAANTRPKRAWGRSWGWLATTGDVLAAVTCHRVRVDRERSRRMSKIDRAKQAEYHRNAAAECEAAGLTGLAEFHRDMLDPKWGLTPRVRDRELAPRRTARGQR